MVAMGSQQIMYRQDPTVLHDSPRLVQLWGFPTNNRQHQAWSPEMQQPALSKTPLFLVKIWKSGFPWKRSPQLPETSPYGFTKSWSSHGWCKGEPWGIFSPMVKAPISGIPPAWNVQESKSSIQCSTSKLLGEFELKPPAYHWRSGWWYHDR